MKFFTDVFLGTLVGTYNNLVSNQAPTFKDFGLLASLIVTVNTYVLSRLIKLSLIAAFVLYENRQWVLFTLMLGTVFQLLNQQP